MSPTSTFAVVVTAFAIFATVHTLASVRLASYRGVAPALLAFVIPPLVPYYGIRARMTGWTIAWCVAGAVYAIALLVAVTWR